MDAMKGFIRRWTVPLMLLALLVGPSSSLPAAAPEIKGLNIWKAGAVPEELERAADLRVAIIRVELPWEQVEPTPNEFDWRKPDRAVEAAAAQGVHVLFTLRSLSGWATVTPADADDLSHGASRPKSMEDWQRFVTLLTQRYRGKPVSYEVENEVNANFWAGSLPDYLALLHATYATVKQVDPGIRVLASAMACGTAFDLRTNKAREKYFERHDAWLRPILESRDFDVINVHDYYFPAGAEVNGWTFRSYLEHVRVLASRAGATGKALWITETGFVSQAVHVGGRLDAGTPESQAAALRAAYEQAAAAGVGRVFWLFLRDHPAAHYFATMGLSDAGGTPQPAWRTYRELAAR